MSYSFSASGLTKDAVKEKVAEELAKVIETQPVHEADQEAAQAAAEAFIDLLAEPAENQEIAISVNGSLGWRAEGEYTGANLGINAHLRGRTVAADPAPEPEPEAVAEGGDKA